MTTDEERFVFRAMLAQLEHEPAEDLLPLTCLVCRSELVDWERWKLCPECRYYYPNEMIAQADPVTWRAIQLGKLACQRCEQALPNTPRVHIDDDGLPIPCPVPVPVARKPKPVREAWWRFRGRIVATWRYWREES